MPAHWLTLDDCVDPAWWRPLDELAAIVAGDPALTPLDPDDFLYAARIERVGWPVLHAYRHVLTRRYLNVDEQLRTWQYTGSDRVGLERYVPLDSVAEALDRADLERGNRLASHSRRRTVGGA